MTQKVLKNLYIACDHAGVEFKSTLIKSLQESLSDTYDIQDMGVNSPDSVDYPDIAHKVCEKMTHSQTQDSIAILICGTGIGMSIAANRFKKIRAALCHDMTTARLARQHNDANILVLGSRILGAQVALDISLTFLSTPFEGGRHQLRLNKLS